MKTALIIILVPVVWLLLSLIFVGLFVADIVGRSPFGVGPAPFGLSPFRSQAKPLVPNA